MKYVTAKQMKRLDQLAIEKYGIPSLLLMENAGRGIADLVGTVLKVPVPFGTVPRRTVPRGTVLEGTGFEILAVCGKGNNGGDGFCAARHLANRGYRVKVALLAHPDELKDDPKVNYRILKKMGVPIEQITDGKRLTQFKTLVRNADLILDAIFGVGLTRPVEGIYFDAISVINQSRKPVLAVDIPSGLNSDTGEELGIAIRARLTGTLAAPKRGLFFGKGPECSGKITVLDISIPKRLINRTVGSRT